MLNTKLVKFLPSLLYFLIVASCENETNQVQLTGKLINWGNAQQILASDAVASDFGLGEDHVIETNEAGEFALKFHLDESTYFSLGRNKLFLEPGEELYLEVDYKDPEAAIFAGDGADKQRFLSGVPFPKAGSYLNGGRELNSPDLMPTLEMVFEQTRQRQMLLLEINASEEFMDLEYLRMKLDEINTILSIPIYGSFKGYWDANEIQKADILLPEKDQLNALGENLMKDEHMKHPNFRDMLYDLVDPHLQENGIFSGLSFTPLMQEYDAFGALIKQLELEGLTSVNQQELLAYINSNIPETYKQMARTKWSEYERLLEGKPAIDLQFTDANTAARSLKEFEGGLIYVDLWATWCGPCIDELPALNELKKEYANEHITFLPLSIDSDKEAWQNFITRNKRSLDMEFIINRSALDEYKLITIPRYFLIDANFNIVTVFAPKPSDPELKELLDDELSKLEL
jgi:thiol-disulfide isomerase/thioredoxin